MNEHNPSAPQRNLAPADDEITLKDIILKIQEWLSILWPQRLKIVILSLAVGLLAALYTKFLTQPTYTASYQLFFQEESGGLSGAMRLASSFGLGVGGGSSSSSATVQEYITSRSNIAHAMTVELDNGRLIDRYFAEAFEEDQEFAQEFHAKFGINQRYTDSVLSEVSTELNEGFVGAQFDEESGVLAFNVASEDEAFTFELAALLVQHTEKQFKDWKREKGADAVHAFQRKVDSLELALDATLRSLGEYQDQNNSLIQSKNKGNDVGPNIPKISYEILKHNRAYKNKKTDPESGPSANDKKAVGPVIATSTLEATRRKKLERSAQKLNISVDELNRRILAVKMDTSK